MTEKRETLIAPLGYQTTPNQYGVFPEGALAQAENVLTRYKGKLVYAPGIGPATSIGSASTQKVYALAPLDSGHVYGFVNDSSGNTWAVSESGNSAAVPSYITSTVGLFPYSRTSPVRSRDRMLVNSSTGVLVGDVMAPASSGDRALRFAGLPQPNISQWNQLTGVSTYPIPNNIMVGYRALATREFSDGYIVKSVPSVGYKYLNTNGSSALVSFRVYFETGLLVGDIIEIYRTDGLSTTVVDSDPGTTYKLIARVALTSTDVGFGFVAITDRVAMSAPFYSTTGKQLYTNPFQEGETGSNRQPDVNGAQAVYKGFTFFADLTERAQATISVPGGIGDSSAMAANAFARANGVGARSGAGTVTSGSNTITGVSAADIAGVRVGQVTLGGTPFPALTKVTAVGASTITMSANATAPNTVWALYDWIEGNLGGFGFSGAIYSADALISIFTLLTHPFEITSNQSILAPTTTGLTQNLTLVLEPSIPVFGSISLRATGGAFYSPPLPDVAATVVTFTATTTPNLMRWSKDSEPEHVPADNETRVGSGKIVQLVSTKDALWIFCTDGIFRLSGDAGVWQINVIAPGCVICSPGCATSMRDQVYAYTNYGFVAVTDAGVVPISDLQIKDQLPGPPYLEGATTNGFLVNNDDDEEVLIFTGFPASKFYVYNARQNSFTYVQNAGTGMSNMTAAAFQQNPASGNAAVLLGDTSTVPKYAAWGRGNTSWLAPTVQYRALYAKNPMSVKQWIDFTLMFETLGQFSVSGAISGYFVGSTTTLVGFNDAYATIGVPRKFAIATSIEPGFLSFSSPFQVVFEGVSCRLVELGNQQVRR